MLKTLDLIQSSKTNKQTNEEVKVKPKGPLHILCLAILAVPIPAFLGCAGHVYVNEEAVLEIESPVPVF